MREPELGDDARDLGGFGAVGLQELPPRRQVVEQIVDLDHRPLACAHLDDRRGRAAVDADLGAGLVAARPGAQHEMGDGRDGGERLAAESERQDGGEIVGAANLARRVALDGEPCVLGRHPFPIVFDADLLLAAQLDVNGHPAGAGVDGVLDQLLDDRGRTFDDLARGDLVCDLRGQTIDVAHVRTPVTRC